MSATDESDMPAPMKLDELVDSLKTIRDGDLNPTMRGIARDILKALSRRESIRRKGYQAGYNVGFDKGFGIRSATDQRDTMERSALRTALENAAKQFRLYETLHLQKSPPDAAKAATNRQFVKMCETALYRSRE